MILAGSSQFHHAHILGHHHHLEYLRVLQDQLESAFMN